MSVDVQMEESDNIVVSIKYITLNLLDPGKVEDDDKNVSFGIVLYCIGDQLFLSAFCPVFLITACPQVFSSGGTCTLLPSFLGVQYTL